MRKTDLPLDIINEHFYTHDSKLYWKKPCSNKSHVIPNSIAGTVTNNGYLIVKFKCKSYLVHRVLYKLYNQVDIIPNEIDHLDGDVSNNSNCNLRLATISENKMNRRIHSNNRSGHKNISRSVVNRLQLWRAQVDVNGKTVEKRFKYNEEGLEQAIEWRNIKLKELHGEFHNLG